MLVKMNVELCWLREFAFVWPFFVLLYIFACTSFLVITSTIKLLHENHASKRFKIHGKVSKILKELFCCESK